MAKEIDFIINKDGSSVEVDMRGFQGPSCGTWMDALAKAIGTITSSKKKPEFHGGSGQSTRVKA